MTTTKTALARVLSVFYLICVCYLCFYNIGTVVDMGGEILGIQADKIFHFILFFPYAFLAYLSFEHKKKGDWESIKFVTITMIVGLLFAGGTEAIQSRIPYRSMDLDDFIANCISIISTSLYVLAVDLGRHSKAGKKAARRHNKN